MDYEFSLKELYDVFLKTTYTMEIAGRTYLPGETLCIFDKIQISNFNEKKAVISAHGGYKDKDRVIWEDSKGVTLTFSQGIFNELQFGLLCNANMVYIEDNNYVKIPKREILESDENGKIILSKTPCGEVFFYNINTGEKLQANKTDVDTFYISTSFLNVACDYYYDYTNNGKIVTIGNQMVKGFLRLEGKTRVKDDITGKTRTGIIEIPKLKLVSGLSMKLGENANPVVANFAASALPVGKSGDNTIMNIFFLENDVDSDI